MMCGCVLRDVAIDAHETSIIVSGSLRGPGENTSMARARRPPGGQRLSARHEPAPSPMSGPPDLVFLFLEWTILFSSTL